MPKEELPIPYKALDLLQEGRIRTLDDVVDLAAEVGGALLRKEIGTTTARELRQWAELMYTGIQAQQIGDSSNNSTNIIAQLVQIAGTPQPLNSNSPQEKLAEPPPLGQPVQPPRPTALPEPEPQPEAVVDIEWDELLKTQAS